MWHVNYDFANNNSFKRIAKKHRAEYDSCFNNLDNLDKLIKLLKDHKFRSFNVSFFQPECDGIYRIAQQGKAGVKETRLYVYMEEDSFTMFILRTGTKESQKRDIIELKKTITKIQ